MGICQSANEARDARGGGEEENQPCPTVFELEVMIEKKRGAAKRLRDNFVHIEFRRGLFEMYCKGRLDGDVMCDSSDTDGGGVGIGDESETLGKSSSTGKDADKMFVATHKVSRRSFFFCCLVLCVLFM